MLTLFDMGKYNFFVWSSMALFGLMLTVDLISIHRQKRSIQRQIKSRQRRKES
ncbi:heme exporter protein CcmD [Marinicella gelatinilytica]|uniref:heme exporter protein CcmD n=1 Tax=Marinicella gelatinilytica TaxID=2996017 RepID=UPI002260DA67|nr:heme exporter protein CcmD [Marinicella gelatinilytica]MCX7543961.1 heme exporter protein CcmD [Marinicella gelatinilytica]